MPDAKRGIGLKAVSLALGCMLCAPLIAGGCPPPELLAPLARRSDGRALPLTWARRPDVAMLMVWAQWRVPEGEALRTFETQLAGDAELVLPPSPAPHRPLKLNIELSVRCVDGTRSSPLTLWQAQFDAPAQCPAVEGLRASASGQGLEWDLPPEPRWQQAPVDFEFHEPGLARPTRASGSRGRLVPPSSAASASVVSAVRRCEEARRSPPTYLRLR